MITHTYTQIAYEKKKNANLQSKLDDEKTEDIKVTTDEFRGQSLRSSSL